MCLSILVYHPQLELEQGTFEGYEYAITKNFIGYRCGYIKLEPDHPWYGIEETNNINARVHGGITFSEADLACNKSGEDNGWWIGFDCAHSGDAVDPSILYASYRNLSYEFTLRHETIKTTEYVRENIKQLIMQAQEVQTNQLS